MPGLSCIGARWIVHCTGGAFAAGHVDIVDVQRRLVGAGAGQASSIGASIARPVQHRLAPQRPGEALRKVSAAGFASRIGGLRRSAASGNGSEAQITPGTG
jgi:hypothetical protein